MSTTITSTEAMVQAIVDAHRATLALPLAPHAVPPAPASDDPVFVAALQAAHELGFIDIDAVCVARAMRTVQSASGITA